MRLSPDQINTIRCPVSSPLLPDDAAHFQVLRLLENRPEISQRQLAAALGVSLGKTNYCVKALLDRGLLKMQNFQNSQRKLAYAYVLTPAGISEKAVLTLRFLARKQAEYEALRVEIENLQRDAAKSCGT
jgi:EPS-associated MarR family transcriptional regulator